MKRAGFITTLTATTLATLARPLTTLGATTTTAISRPRRTIQQATKRLAAGQARRAIITASTQNTARIWIGDSHVARGGTHVRAAIPPGQYAWLTITDFSDLYAYTPRGTQTFYTGGLR